MIQATRKCPICRKPRVAEHTPFCSTACRDRDLLKWLHDDYAEVKRVYVPPRARGLGLARAMMARLEAEALAEGRGILRLETGIHQPEALGLYEALGYARRGPFGDYGPDPLSVFMEKPLAGFPLSRE